MTQIQQGLAPADRKLSTKRANQWQNTPQQNKFMESWLDVDSPTFGNAYQSATAAGYSDNYSKQLASIGLKWLTEYNKISKLELEHLELKLIKMINGVPNSKSPDDTKIKAIEMIAKLRGMLTDNSVAPQGVNISINLNSTDKVTEVIDQESAPQAT